MVMQKANMSLLRPGGRQPFVLTVGASSLYDLKKGWDGKGGLNGYHKFQREHPDLLPDPGPAHALTHEVLALNEQYAEHPVDNALFRVAIPTHHKFANSLRLIRALNRDFGPYLDRSLRRISYLNGRSPIEVLRELKSDLYLAGNPRYALEALQNGFGAVHLMPAEHQAKTNFVQDPLLWSWDGDNTIWDGISEELFQAALIRGGMDFAIGEFNKNEQTLAAVPSLEGPLFEAFAAACSVRSVFGDFGISPFQLAVITARGMMTQERIHTTLEALGLIDYVDIVEPMSGEAKGPPLRLHRASLHIDDGKKHSDSAAAHGVIAGHVVDGITNAKLIEELLRWEY